MLRCSCLFTFPLIFVPFVPATSAICLRFLTHLSTLPALHLLIMSRKVHLFDIDIPGKITFKESMTLTAGEGPTVVDTDVGRLGIGICYDLRFPELSAIYAQRGVQLIVIPGEQSTARTAWPLQSFWWGVHCTKEGEGYACTLCTLSREPELAAPWM